MAEQDSGQATWLYTSNGEQKGPITFADLARLAASGKLQKQDYIWTDGMPDWVTADSKPELFRVRAVAVRPVTLTKTPVVSRGATVGGTTVARTPVVRGSGAQSREPIAKVEPQDEGELSLEAIEPSPASGPALAYYSSGMPARASTNLNKHARPTGDTGDWPLDEVRVTQMSEALRLRKPIQSAAQLCRLLLVIMVISTTITFFVMAAAALGGGGGGVGLLIVAGVSGALTGLCVLYYLLWQATSRSKRWAPLTLLIFMGVGILVNVLSIMLSDSRNGVTPLVSALVVTIFPALFMVIAWRAYNAIPKYLSTPAWCQELVALAKL